MIKIALLGFGTVGSGVAEVIDNNRRVISRRLGEQPEIAHILDLRDFPDSPYAGKIVHDIDTILADPEVRIVAEMMGGVHPAADFTKAAIEAGKSVVTSNKAVVAEEGDKLLRLARKHGVRYLFEASVGGGIPCLRTLADSLSCNDIISVRGILNGSTNYMLTEMTKRGIGYGDILPEARALGYLEADPTADVGGFDAARKIIILAAMAWGKLLPLDAVSTVGITGITPGDISAAAAAGKKIKLVAEATRTGGRISCSVSPRLTSPGSMLYSVDGPFNAVEINSSAAGRTLLYGCGAGKLPTASAVVSDIIEAALRPSEDLPAYRWTKAGPDDILVPGCADGIRPLCE